MAIEWYVLAVAGWVCVRASGVQRRSLHRQWANIHEFTWANQNTCLALALLLSTPCPLPPKCNGKIQR